MFARKEEDDRKPPAFKVLKDITEGNPSYTSPERGAIEFLESNDTNPLVHGASILNAWKLVEEAGFRPSDKMKAVYLTVRLLNHQREMTALLVEAHGSGNVISKSIKDFLNYAATHAHVGVVDESLLQSMATGLTYLSDYQRHSAYMDGDPLNESGAVNDVEPQTELGGQGAITEYHSAAGVAEGMDDSVSGVTVEEQTVKTRVARTKKTWNKNPVITSSKKTLPQRNAGAPKPRYRDNRGWNRKKAPHDTP